MFVFRVLVDVVLFGVVLVCDESLDVETSDDDDLDISDEDDEAEAADVVVADVSS